MNTQAAPKRILGAMLMACLAIGGTANANDDSMTERLRACAGCHEQAQSVEPQALAGAANYAPSIKGKPVEYLYQQLLNYREGRRLNKVMNQMLANLSTDYLHEIASHYARQAVETQPLESSSQSAERAEYARQLVQQDNPEQPACAACHGADLRGNNTAIPSLRGLSAAYITAQLGAWQTDTRHARQPDCMRDVAKSLSGDDIDAVAHWIAAASDTQLPPGEPPDTLPLPCGAVQ